MDLFRRLFTQSPTKPEETAVQQTTERPKEAAKTPPQPVVPTAGAETTPLGPPPLNDLPPPQIPDGATRPLPPETAIASSNEHVTFGQTTDIGMVRSNNQDSSFTFLSVSRNADQRPDFGLFIVADGMGGHHDGEKPPRSQPMWSLNISLPTSTCPFLAAQMMPIVLPLPNP